MFRKRVRKGLITSSSSYNLFFFQTTSLRRVSLSKMAVIYCPLLFSNTDQGENRIVNCLSVGLCIFSRRGYVRMRLIE